MDADRSVPSIKADNDLGITFNGRTVFQFAHGSSTANPASLLPH
jgi:hypothetical protein